MGPETPSIPTILQEFRSEVEPLRAVANIAFQLLAMLPRDKMSYEKTADASRGEGILSEKLMSLINVIEGKKPLNKYLASFIIEMWGILRIFIREFSQKLGEQTVQAAIDTLGRILDCDEVVKMKKENPVE